MAVCYAKGQDWPGPRCSSFETGLNYFLIGGPQKPYTIPFCSSYVRTALRPRWVLLFQMNSIFLVFQSGRKPQT